MASATSIGKMLTCATLPHTCATAVCRVTQCILSGAGELRQSVCNTDLLGHKDKRVVGVILQHVDGVTECTGVRAT